MPSLASRKCVIKGTLATFDCSSETLFGFIIIYNSITWRDATKYLTLAGRERWQAIVATIKMKPYLLRYGFCV